MKKGEKSLPQINYTVEETAGAGYLNISREQMDYAEKRIFVDYSNCLLLKSEEEGIFHLIMGGVTRMYVPSFNGKKVKNLKLTHEKNEGLEALAKDLRLPFRRDASRT